MTAVEPDIDSDDIYCAVCTVSVPLESLEEHEYDDEHQHIAKKCLLEFDNDSIMCKACYMPIESEAAWKTHVKSSEHVRQVAMLHKAGKKESYSRPCKIGKIDETTIITDSFFKEIPDLYSPLSGYSSEDVKEKYEPNSKQNNSDYHNNRRNKRRKENETYPRLRSFEEIKNSGKGRRNIDSSMSENVHRRDSRENRHFREPDLGHMKQKEFVADLPTTTLPTTTLPTGPLIPPPAMILPSSNFPMPTLPIPPGLPPPFPPQFPLPPVPSLFTVQTPPQAPVLASSTSPGPGARAPLTADKPDLPEFKKTMPKSCPSISFQDGIPPLIEPIIKPNKKFTFIGVNCVKILGPNHFLCELCDVPFNDKSKEEHLTDPYHLLNVLWNWDPKSAQSIKDMESVSKAAYITKIHEAAQEIEKKEVRLLSEMQLRTRARILEEDVENQLRYFIKHSVFKPEDFAAEYDFSFLEKKRKKKQPKPTRERSAKEKILEAGILNMVKTSKPEEIVTDEDTALASFNICGDITSELGDYFSNFQGIISGKVMEDLKTVKHYLNNLMIIQQILDVYPTAVKDDSSSKEKASSSNEPSSSTGETAGSDYTAVSRDPMSGGNSKFYSLYSQ